MPERAGEVTVIVEPGACSAAWLLLAAQCANAIGARACVLGTGDDRRAAESLGMRVAKSCAPLMGSAFLGWNALARAFGPSVRHSTVIAWSPNSAALGSALARKTVVIAPCAPATPETRKLLAHGIRARSQVDVLPHCAAAAEGWPRAQSWRVHAPLTALPAVEPTGNRADLRQRWGVAEGEFAVGLFGDPPHTADAQRAVDIVGRATLALGIAPRCRFVLVVHPHARHARTALRWAQTTPTLVRVAFDSTISRSWAVSSALDAALFADAVPPARSDRSSLSLMAAALAGGGADADAVGGAIDALMLARAGIPVLATAQSAAASLMSAVPELTFCERRPTVGAHALISVLLKRASFHEPLRTYAASLPGPAALRDRIGAMLPGQRVAA